MAELLALLSILGLSAKGRAAYGVPRSKLLDTLLEAMAAQPVHANQIQAGCQVSPSRLSTTMFTQMPAKLISPSWTNSSSACMERFSIHEGAADRVWGKKLRQSAYNDKWCHERCF